MLLIHHPGMGKTEQRRTFQERVPKISPRTRGELIQEVLKEAEEDGQTWSPTGQLHDLTGVKTLLDKHGGSRHF